jgi:hypothetical protein
MGSSNSTPVELPALVPENVNNASDRMCPKMSTKAHPEGAAGDCAPQGDKKLKPCCACPETKRIRDEW